MTGIPAFQQRVISEKFDLEDKVVKLTEFTKSALWFKIPDEEKQRLILQLHLMNAYAIVLGDRIAHFSGAPA